jgi:perosamine synthetase
LIPITTVHLGSDVEESVLRVIRSGNIAQGPVVAEFEDRFAALLGAQHAIAVNNGTTALVAALQVLDLQPGDEVITSPFTFIATLNAILEAGATVRFGDIRMDDFGLDPESVRAQITERTRVIMPVHLYGQSADLGPLREIAREHDLRLVEDAAQAHGATYEGKAVGTFDLGCYSFYATKNLTTGEGGAITTDDDRLAERLRILRNQGMRARYEYVAAGHNYRLTDLQAAVVLPQLDAYPALVSARRRNAAGLIERLRGIPDLVLPSELPGRGHVWHQFTILLPEGVVRDTFVDAMAEAGVGTGIYYPKPVYDYGPYADRPDVVRSPTPTAAAVAARCVSLPVHQHLAADDLDTIAAAVRSTLGA